jgi:hypothetical protein
MFGSQGAAPSLDRNQHDTEEPVCSLDITLIARIP